MTITTFQKLEKIIIIVLFFLVYATNLHSQTKTENSNDNKAAEKWFKNRQWLNGLETDPHFSINKIEFYKQYHSNQTRWDKAFAYLKITDLTNLKPGKYPIDGDNVFATVAETKSKEFEVSTWESHRQYIDIHLVISGKEKIGVAPLSDLTVSKPYDAAIDAAFYSGDGKYYVAEPGNIFIFFPSDAHRPNIKTKDFDSDKKIVIKIRTN